MPTSPSPIIREFYKADALMRAAVGPTAVHRAAQFLTEQLRFQQRVAEQILKPSKLLQEVLTSIKREDGEFRALAERARALGAHGWTVPLWAPPRVTMSFLVDDDRDSVSRDLLAYFSASKGRNARTLVRSVYTAPQLAKWGRLLRQAASAFNRRQYSLVIPALFVALEGRIAHAVGMEKSRKLTVIKNAATGRVSARSGIAVASWASVQGFVETTFRKHDFADAPPQGLNRHWALHGRAEPHWTRTQALMLWQAISTISTLDS